MATSNIKALISGELSKVWELVLNVENYGAWRSDLSKTEVISDKQFIEYTKDGYPTTFTVTLVEPYRRWEFDMENSNMTGHWIGVFTDKGNETEIDFMDAGNKSYIGSSACGCGRSCNRSAFWIIQWLVGSIYEDSTFHRNFRKHGYCSWTGTYVYGFFPSIHAEFGI